MPQAQPAKRDKRICLWLASFSFFVSSKKDKSDVGIPHVLLEEPVYSVKEQVFYPPTKTSYGIAPVTSSYPQPTSLDAYRDVSMHDVDGGGMSAYDSLLGQPVPPPSSGLRQTNSAISELEDSSDDWRRTFKLWNNNCISKGLLGMGLFDEYLKFFLWCFHNVVCLINFLNFLPFCYDY